MDVPDRGTHPNRAQGDHTSPHDGSFRLQMQRGNSPATLHASVEHAEKHADHIATGMGHPVEIRVSHPSGHTTGGFGSPLNDTEAASYKEFIKRNPVKVAPGQYGK